MPHHHDALGELVGPRVGRVRAQHVDPGLLEVVDVHDVVDVAEQVEVGPAEGALIAVAHHSMVAESATGPRQGAPPWTSRPGQCAKWSWP